MGSETESLAGSFTGLRDSWREPWAQHLTLPERFPRASRGRRGSPDADSVAFPIVAQSSALAPECRKSSRFESQKSTLPLKT